MFMPASNTHTHTHTHTHTTHLFLLSLLEELMIFLRKLFEKHLESDRDMRVCVCVCV